MRSMNGNLRRVVLLLLLLAPPAVGCAAQKRPQWLAWGKSKEEPALHVETPGERLEKLRKLASEVKKLPAAETERISTDLAQAISKEQDPLLRAQILRTLAEFPTETASRVLAAGLADSEADVRVAACEAWGQRAGPEAVQRLSETLGADTNIDVRLAAARALASCPDQKTVAALGLALEDHDPALQRRAIQSLEKVTGRHFGNDVVAWREYVQGRDPKPDSESLVSRIFRLF
jgi:HEAT repeats